MKKNQVVENTETDDLLDLENIEIRPLSDEELESVTGAGCSLWCCSNG